MHETNQLRSGAAMIDITPPAGTHLSGSGAGEHRPAQAVMDPLFAKAIVFETGEQRVCMVILDLTIVTGDYTDQIRAAISEQTGIAPEAIMVQATQTHSAPSLGYFMLDPDFPLETTAGNRVSARGRARLRRPGRCCRSRSRSRSSEQAATCAHRLGTRRIRGFGLQPPWHTPRRQHRHAQATGSGAAAVWDRRCLLSRRADGPGSRRVLHPRYGYAAAGLSPALHLSPGQCVRISRDLPGPCRRIGLALGRDRCSSYSAPTPCR